MTLHYRALPDLTGVEYGPMPTTPSTPLRAPSPEHLRRGTPLPALHSGYARFGKRALDVTLATVALILAAPVLIVLALALWLESGNPFFTQDRLGLNGRRFRMLKLRTMVIGAENRLEEYLDRDPMLRTEWELTQKLKRDPRITPLGRLLRKTSMDELPQILNVIKGDMSLVGPRPMLPAQLPLYLNPEAYLGLRPGITGLWQVTARNEDSFELRAVIDQRYAQRLSFGHDLQIIGATFGAVWRATGY